MNAELVALIEAEIKRAEAVHGPLTIDNFRALAILVEEVGEVSRGLLELRRAQMRNPHDACLCCNQVVAELVQVIATAALLVENLKECGT